MMMGLKKALIWVYIFVYGMDAPGQGPNSGSH